MKWRKRGNEYRPEVGGLLLNELVVTKFDEGCTVSIHGYTITQHDMSMMEWSMVGSSSPFLFHDACYGRKKKALTRAKDFVEGYVNSEGAVHRDLTNLAKFQGVRFITVSGTLVDPGDKSSFIAMAGEDLFAIYPGSSKKQGPVGEIHLDGITLEGWFKQKYVTNWF